MRSRCCFSHIQNCNPVNNWKWSKMAKKKRKTILFLLSNKLFSYWRNTHFIVEVKDPYTRKEVEFKWSVCHQLWTENSIFFSDYFQLRSLEGIFNPWGGQGGWNWSHLQHWFKKEFKNNQLFKITFPGSTHYHWKAKTMVTFMCSEYLNSFS